MPADNELPILALARRYLQEVNHYLLDDAGELVESPGKLSLVWSEPASPTPRFLAVKAAGAGHLLINGRAFPASETGIQQGIRAFLASTPLNRPRAPTPAPVRPPAPADIPSNAHHAEPELAGTIKADSAPGMMTLEAVPSERVEAGEAALTASEPEPDSTRGAPGISAPEVREAEAVPPEAAAPEKGDAGPGEPVSVAAPSHVSTEGVTVPGIAALEAGVAGASGEESEAGKPVVEAATTSPAVLEPAADTTALPPKPTGLSEEPSAGEAAHVVFRARPAQTRALTCFWLFLLGSGLVYVLLGGSGAGGMNAVGAYLALALGLALEITVCYALIRNHSTRYELTTRELSLTLHGKPIRLPVAAITSVRCTQTTLQRLLGLGNLWVEAELNGELLQVALRDLHRCPVRAKQFRSLLKGTRE